LSNQSLLKTDMNKFIISLVFTVFSFLCYSQVGVGTSDPKAALDVTSTDSGFLMPRIADHNALVTGVEQIGMMVFDLATNSIWVWNGSLWSENEIVGSDGDTSSTNEIQTSSTVNITDTANNFGSSNVEGALTELASRTFDPFFVDVSGRDNRTFSNAFTTYLHPSVNYDPTGAYNTSTGVITIPSDGIYQITGTMRVADRSSSGVQYGVGVHTSNIDGSWFLWHAVLYTSNPNDRTTYPYIRVGHFNAGDQLRMFVYVDNGPLRMSTGAFQVLKTSN
jgi:hypothetical protein|tara:strand:+ start:50349 stop:51182 length:834 start_codon:yes stop_codon:yes gene_type:complete